MLAHLVVVWLKIHIMIMAVATVVNSRKCQHFSHSAKFRCHISSSPKFMKKRQTLRIKALSTLSIIV